MVDLSAAQDIEAGDGTTSVVVLAGSLLTAAETLLAKGIHPTTIAECFTKAAQLSSDYLTEISTKLDLKDRESLLRAASTSLNSKIVSQYSTLLSPIAVDSVLKVCKNCDTLQATNPPSHITDRVFHIRSLILLLLSMLTCVIFAWSPNWEELLMIHS